MSEEFVTTEVRAHPGNGFDGGFDLSGIDKPGVIENFAAALHPRLSEHYMTASAVIRACDFGVPQARPRFFLIGARKDMFPPGTVDEFFAALQAQRASFLAVRGLPQAPTSRDAISDLELARNGSVPCAECEGFDEIAYGAARTSYQEVMRDGHVGAPSDLRLARHRPEIRERFASIIRACREDGRLNTTISSDVRKAHGLKKMAIRVLDPLSAAPTITSLPDDLLHYRASHAYRP